jgi:hypothetical protein
MSKEEFWDMVRLILLTLGTIALVFLMVIGFIYLMVHI